MGIYYKMFDTDLIPESRDFEINGFEDQISNISASDFLSYFTDVIGDNLK